MVSVPCESSVDGTLGFRQPRCPDMLDVRQPRNPWFPSGPDLLVPTSWGGPSKLKRGCSSYRFHLNERLAQNIPVKIPERYHWEPIFSSKNSLNTILRDLQRLNTARLIEIIFLIDCAIELPGSTLPSTSKPEISMSSRLLQMLQSCCKSFDVVPTI